MKKSFDEEVEEVDKVIDNISHNKMLQRNWERMKLLMKKKEAKGGAEKREKENNRSKKVS